MAALEYLQCDLVEFIPSSSDRQVLIGAYIEEPWVNDCFPQYPVNCSDPGWDMKMLMVALNILGYQATFRVLESREEVLKGLIRGYFNASGIMVSLATTLDSDIEVTQPFIEDFPIFAMSSDMLDRKLTQAKSLILSSVNIQTCLLLVSSFFLQSGIEWVVKRRRGAKRGVRGEKLSRALWFLVFGLFLNIFASYVTINLFKPPPRGDLFKTYDELADLLDKKECRMILYEDYVDLRKVIYPADSSIGIDNRTVKKLLSAYKKNPPTEAKASPQAILGHLLGDSSQCKIGLVYYSAVPYLERLAGKGRIEFIKLPEITGNMFGYAVQRGTILAEELKYYSACGSPSDQYRLTIERSEERAKGRQFFTAYSTSNVTDTPFRLAGSRPLNLLDLVDTLWFLLACSSLAFATLLLEICFGPMAASTRGSHHTISCLV